MMMTNGYLEWATKDLKRTDDGLVVFCGSCYQGDYVFMRTKLGSGRVIEGSNDREVWIVLDRVIMTEEEESMWFGTPDDSQYCECSDCYMSDVFDQVKKAVEGGSLVIPEGAVSLIRDHLIVKASALKKAKDSVVFMGRLFPTQLIGRTIEEIVEYRINLDTGLVLCRKENSDYWVELRGKLFGKYIIEVEYEPTLAVSENVLALMERGIKDVLVVDGFIHSVKARKVEDP